MSAWKNLPAWEPALVPSRTLPWADRLKGVLADLDVERAPRYRSSVVDGKKKTFCNIFVTDVVRNMGLAAPLHWMTGAGDPATMGQGIEMSANRLHGWFPAHGARFGWWSADEGTAVSAAARGHLVLGVWRNETGPGHIAVVLGERDEATRIAQAGEYNFNDTALTTGFGKKPVSFWVQAERVGDETPHHP
jgi:hypothetical protein